MSEQGAGGAAMGAVVAFLRLHPPFDHMEPEALAAFARSVRVAYFGKDEILLSPQSGVVQSFHVVHRGRVSVERSDTDLAAGARHFALGPGECFPIGSLLGARATRNTYRAGGDVFCYVVEGNRFRELLRESPALLGFCTNYLATLLTRSRSLVQAHSWQISIEQHGMAAQLAGLLRRSPVSCAPGATVGEVLERMRKEKVGSMVVVDAAAAPLGIFTERDVLERVAVVRLDLAVPIAQVMTPSPRMLAENATAADAALTMTRHGIRHVVVVDGARLKGVVSERDLFAIQRVSLRQVSANIGAASTVDEVRRAAADIRILTHNLIAQGVGAESLTQFIAELNDGVTRRIIELELAEHELADLPFCWMALGSEGRLEQTFSTDQDNGIIFEAAPGDADRVRERLLPFAQDVNRALDACGFPLCKGNIMAGNPKWCLSLGEWETEFSDWIRNSAPEALLNAAIFFDFRAIWGVAGLAARLREWLLATASVNRRFLHQMAENALQTRAPLALLHDFTTSGEGRDAQTLDLKGQGARLFVDAARIFALQHRVAETATAPRLRAAAAAMEVEREDVAAIVEAFFFIQQLRLRHQFIDTDAGASSPNRVSPDRLNALDRRILKEALRQARRLQKRIALDYLA